MKIRDASGGLFLFLFFFLLEMIKSLMVRPLTRLKI
jgi:hypothetical protein